MSIKNPKYILTLLGLVFSSWAHGTPVKLDYSLSAGATVRVFAETKKIKKGEFGVAISILLFDPRISLPLDLLSGAYIESNEQMQTEILPGVVSLPRPDVIPSNLPQGVLIDKVADLNKNLLEDGMFVIRNLFLSDKFIANNKAYVFSVVEDMKTLSSSRYVVNEPGILSETKERHFSFAIVHKDQVENAPDLNLLVSIADTNVRKEVKKYGVALVGTDGNFNAISTKWTDFTGRGSDFQFVQDKKGKIYIYVDGKEYDDIGSANTKGMLWMNSRGFSAYSTFSDEIDVGNRKLNQRNAIADLINFTIDEKGNFVGLTHDLELDLNKGQVIQNVELNKRFFEDPKIAQALQRKTIRVLASQVTIYPQTSQFVTYARFEVSFKNTGGFRKATWLARLNAVTGEIQGVVKLTPLQAKQSSQILPGGVLLMDEGKFKSVDKMLCKALF